MNREKIIIVALSILLVWFGIAIVKLESYRYADQVGLCQEYSRLEDFVERERCLHETKTRTSPLWHLFYGLSVS